MASEDAALVAHTYHSAYNAITQPSSLVTCSRYFVARWMPLLGGEGTRIVLALRSLGYYNPKTGERNEQIPITLAELAKLAGISVATLKREFAAKPTKRGEPVSTEMQNPTLHLFVTKQKQLRRCKVTGRVFHEENIYNVKMDDPIHPDDLPRLQQIIDEMNKASLPKAQNEPQGRLPKAQNELPQAQSEPSQAQSESNPIQNEPTLNLTLNIENTSTSSRDSASPRVGVTQWAKLSGTERDQWRRQARAQLTEALLATMTEASASLAIDSRARGIYEQAQKAAGA